MISKTPLARVEAPLPRRRVGLFAALRFRDFRLLWFGLLVSNLGTWMQFTALGYFVTALAPTPRLGSLYLGLLGAARAIPVLICSPIAGVVADTWPRRRVLFATNSLISALALVLAIFTSLHRIGIWGVLAISGVQAAALAFDAPARQSWVPLLVDREHIGNAIGLNSIAFNAPAVIGPAIAGFLIASVSVAGAFYGNAIATLAVVAALIFMRESPPSATRSETILTSVLRGMQFLFGHRILRWVITTFIVTALLTRPYSLLLPAYALHYLHTDARGLGWLIAATGVGGFGGAIVTAWLGSRQDRGLLWLLAAAVMCLGVAVLGMVSSFAFAIIDLIIIGLATLAFLGISNILIQTLSPQEVRGRAISVYSMVALGFVPGGALIVGSMASLVGLHVAFEFAGGACLGFVLWIWFALPLIRTV